MKILIVDDSRAMRMIVTRHHGTIELETELGRGTTFRVRLPLAQKKATRS